ncbi:Fur family transcriptional regulator [Aureispira anguillae]|uniref:Transcriptional repressor n=1 Tax=Aureispira anguillae TaxID=2864201 RepID=A0A915YE89_9BACT|nr:transcriptional repressor [Aureispira anguillae]BDS11403.1 transcriptional repressor [Aureispira anguillae]
MKSTRNTAAKSAIHKLLKDSTTALSHRDIQDQVGELCNRVTIYRILDRLVEEGEIHKIVNTDGVIKYATCHQCEAHHHHSHNHVHFSCTKCHSVTCLDDVKPSYTLPANYLVKEVNFTLSGICPNCIE